MLRSTLLIALRRLRFQPTYTAINVGGLGLGLACCFLIVLFIQHERSFDDFHANGDRIYRLATDTGSGGELTARTPAGLGPLLDDRNEAIEQTVRYTNRGSADVRLATGEVQRIGWLSLADPEIVDVFSLSFQRGTPEAALSAPHSLVLTETQAATLFGDADPMGQTLRYGEIDLTVTGVVDDPPVNTHLDFTALGSFRLMLDIAGPDALEDFNNWNYRTYVLLASGEAPEAVAEETGAFLKERFGENFAVGLDPLQSLRLNTEVADYDMVTRDPNVLWLFGAVGALILLIACINFTNLATARALSRAREVGVRKSLGAARGQLIRQFLSESVLLSVFAILVGLVGTTLALPLFNEALGGSVPLHLVHPGTLAVLLGIGLGAGLLAGCYPALYLTRFDPVRVLKGDLTTGGGGASVLRKSLIVAQFAASAFLLVATLTVVDQLRFMRSQDLGFAQEQVVSFSPPGELLEQYDAFEEALASDPDVLSAALSNGLPGSTGMSRAYTWPGATEREMSEDNFVTILGDADYIDTVGLELTAGRGFRDAEADIDNAYILNETAVREIGLEAPVGHPFRAWDGEESGTIIGVVEDFHYSGLRNLIEPLVLHYKPEWMQTIAVRFPASGVAPGIEHLQETFEQFAPGYALDYRFLDEGFERQYRDEVRLSTLLGFFAGVAVFIACLGVFALTALAAEQRRKELGIRKVLGASVQTLTAMLTRDVVLLVLVAFGIAAPLAWVAMRRWLEGFAYAADLGPGVFLLAGGGVLLLSLLTVSTQALRAASADPVRALRDE
ncbi:MAG: FtsX-like permease family protein [Bacteroidota bacterium]